MRHDSRKVKGIPGVHPKRPGRLQSGGKPADSAGKLHAFGGARRPEQGFAQKSLAGFHVPRSRKPEPRGLSPAAGSHPGHSGKTGKARIPKSAQRLQGTRSHHHRRSPKGGAVPKAAKRKFQVPDARDARQKRFRRFFLRREHRYFRTVPNQRSHHAGIQFQYALVRRVGLGIQGLGHLRRNPSRPSQCGEDLVGISPKRISNICFRSHRHATGRSAGNSAKQPEPKIQVFFGILPRRKEYASADAEKPQVGKDGRRASRPDRSSRPAARVQKALQEFLRHGVAPVRKGLAIRTHRLENSRIESRVAFCVSKKASQGQDRESLAIDSFQIQFHPGKHSRRQCAEQALS